MSVHVNHPRELTTEVKEALERLANHGVPPGGGGKAPVNPAYTLYHDEEKIVIRNYEGKVFEYPEAANEAVSEVAEMNGDAAPSPLTAISADAPPASSQKLESKSDRAANRDLSAQIPCGCGKD